MTFTPLFKPKHIFVEYTELSIPLASLKNNFKDVVIAELGEIGFESFLEEKSHLLAYIPTANYNESKIRELSDQFHDFVFASKVIPQQNWNAQWESSFEPIEIDDYCFIRAPFHEPKPDYTYQILIEPKMSFGTGHHATTRLMIRLMRKVGMSGKKVLDMGCGTGVLGILAKMSGAKLIDGIDIDQWAVENTRENAHRNLVSFNSLLLGGASQINDNYDVILANINRNILLEDMAQYTMHMKNGGYLFLSGFLEADVAIIKDKAGSFNLELMHQISEDQWMAMVFKAAT